MVSDYDEDTKEIKYKYGLHSHTGSLNSWYSNFFLNGSCLEYCTSIVSKSEDQHVSLTFCE